MIGTPLPMLVVYATCIALHRALRSDGLTCGALRRVSDTVSARMVGRHAKSRYRQPPMSPGADVAGVSPVLAQM